MISSMRPALSGPEGQGEKAATLLRGDAPMSEFGHKGRKGLRIAGPDPGFRKVTLFGPAGILGIKAGAPGDFSRAPPGEAEEFATKGRPKVMERRNKSIITALDIRTVEHCRQKACAVLDDGRTILKAEVSA